MSSFWLEPKDLASIVDRAEHAYPQECCGLLVGKIQGDQIMAIEVYPMTNQWDQGDPALAMLFEAEAMTGLPEKPAKESAKEPAKEPNPRPTAERRYTIDPRAMLDVQKLARDRGLVIVGIYHSHPEHLAIPSEYDRRFAWAEYVYPIVSVRRGYASDVRIWKLDDHQQFYELELHLLGNVNSG